MTPHHASRHLHAVDGAVADPFVDDEFARRQLDLFEPLLRYVGGADALWALDAAPLPDEPFDWTAVEPVDRVVVAEVLTRTDECCGVALGDVELRTIARRLLALIAASDPRPLRRSTNLARLAAGVVWLAGQGCGGFARRGRASAAWIWEWFDVGSCVDRGRSLYYAAGLAWAAGWTGSRGPLPFSDAGLLHSRFRASLAHERDHLIELANTRRTWSLDGCDGPIVRFNVRARAAKPLSAIKAAVDGRDDGVVIVGFGDDLEAADYFSLSIPDAHDLVHLLEQALGMPMPGLGAS
jgi:hypothetical protein